MSVGRRKAGTKSAGTLHAITDNVGYALNKLSPISMLKIPTIAIGVANFVDNFVAIVGGYSENILENCSISMTVLLIVLSISFRLFCKIDL